MERQKYSLANILHLGGDSNDVWLLTAMANHPDHYEGSSQRIQQDTRCGQKHLWLG